MRVALVQGFGRLWSSNTNGIDCMGTASPDREVSHDITVKCKDYYDNKITEIWYAVRLIVEAGQFRGMTEEVLHEYCNREWEIVGKNKTKLQPKEKMKKATGRSRTRRMPWSSACMAPSNGASSSNA